MKNDFLHVNDSLLALFNSAPTAIVAMDPDGIVIQWNTAAERMFGWRREEVIGRFIPVVPDDGLEEHRALRRRVMAGENLSNIEVLRRKKDSSRIHINVSAAPLKNEYGQITGIISVNIDITDRMLRDAEIRKLNAKLEQNLLSKEESLKRMAGAIAHLFNNQLSIVIGNLELVMDDVSISPGNHSMLADAMAASRKSVDISRMMLTYLGQSSGRLENLDLSETCQKGLLMVQPAIPGNIKVKTAIPFPGPPVTCNMEQLLHVIIHLMTNAREFLEGQPGTIALSVKTVSAADIPASNRFPHGWQPKESVYACVEVADTGCGIPKENMEKIFDPFFTTRFTGRGLGLSVVQGILTAHGGAVTVENNTEGGCAFRVFLPVVSKTAPVQAVKKADCGNIQDVGAVLLIDDQQQVRNLARVMLSRLGYADVLEAPDGVAAVEMFRRHRDRIRFVITDLTMPGMDGWQTLAALRKLSPRIPVILSSGYDESRVMEGAHSEVPQAFLSKPYKKQDLQEAIEKILSIAKLDEYSP